MDIEKAEEIIMMYGNITDSNCITVLQANAKTWNKRDFWEAANFLLQNHDYGMEVV